MSLLDKIESLLQLRKDVQKNKQQKQLQWEKQHPQIMKLKKKATKLIKKLK